MPAVTVLYAPRDEALGLKIADALARQGHIARHAPQRRDRDLALNDDAAIIIWSEAALRLARLHDQASDALLRGALIPVAVDGAAPPEGFDVLPPVDLSGWRGDDDDPRWRFVLEELALLTQLPDQALAPAAETALQDPGVAPADEALPQTKKRWRFHPVAVAFSAGAALAVAAGAAVLLSTSPRDAAPTPGRIAFVQPIDETAEPSAADETQSAPATQAAEQPDFELTVLREPAQGASQEAVPATLETAAGEVAPSAPDLETVPGTEEVSTDEPASPESDPALAAQPAAQEAAPDSADPESAASDADASDPGVTDLGAVDQPVAGAAAEPAANDASYFRDCESCPQMARIPAGTFRMGSPASEPMHQASEGPQQDIAIARPFAIGAREVIFAEWDACVADGGCNAYRPYDHDWGREARPVVNVSFDDAQAYVRWLSQKTGATYRLPSEAEWEYAARAGSAGPFALDGVLTPQNANYDARYPYIGEPAETRAMTTPTGSFAPNALGLYDMHGNVWEWTADCWAGALADVSANGAARATGDCAKRTLRGGAWNTGGWRLRSAHRIGKTLSAREFDNGFRVVKELN